MIKKILIIKVLLSVLFIGCLFNWNYGYYQLIRFLGMVGFGILAYENYEKNKTWFIIWLSSAILINPLFKITLGGEIWNIVDIIWAVLLIVSIFIKRKNEKGNLKEPKKNLV